MRLALAHDGSIARSDLHRPPSGRSACNELMESGADLRYAARTSVGTDSGRFAPSARPTAAAPRTISRATAPRASLRNTPAGCSSRAGMTPTALWQSFRQATVVQSSTATASAAVPANSLTKSRPNPLSGTLRLIGPRCTIRSMPSCDGLRSAGQSTITGTICSFAM